MSGNYRVLVYDDDQKASPEAFAYKGHPVLAEAWFKVVDPLVNVRAEVSSNTDIDTHVAHQQVTFAIDHADYTIELKN